MVAVVAPFFGELRGVVDQLRRVERVKLSSGIILYKGTPKGGNRGVIAAVIGMGSRVVAPRLTQLLEEYPEISRVFLVGVGGGFSPLSVGDLISPSMVYYKNRSFPLLPMNRDSLQLHSGAIYSADHPVEQEEGIGIQQEHPEVVAVDMESGAVASIATEQGAEVTVIRIISDMVDSPRQSSEQWEADKTTVLAQLEEFLRSLPIVDRDI